MAGYSKQQLHNDMQYVLKALEPIDSRIEMPDCLHADQLRAKIENIEPVGLEKKKEPKPKSERILRWPDRLFNLQSGLTYAAAFALMIVLFYGLKWHKPEMIAGDIPVSPADSQANELAKAHSETPEAAVEAMPESAQMRAFSNDQIPSSKENQQEILGVGGAGKSIPLGEYDGMQLIYRENDATDPDKEGIPVTIDIINAEETLLGQINLEDIQTIYSFFTHETGVTLVGESSEGVVTSAYSLSDPTHPQNMASVIQPGEFITSRLFQDLVHTITRTSEPPGADVTNLPGADIESYIVISALQTQTAETTTKAFATSSEGEVLLYNRNAYISYMKHDDPEDMEQEEPEQSESNDILVAQIKLDGTQIELGSVSQDEMPNKD